MRCAPTGCAKKVEAGAQFIQTNYIYDVPRFERFMERVRDLGLDGEVFILAGVGPLASARAANWMRTNVPGIHVPDEVIARLEGAEKQGLEGKKICIELIQQMREIKGVSGVPCHGLPARGTGVGDHRRVRRARRPPCRCARAKGAETAVVVSVPLFGRTTNRAVRICTERLGRTYTFV